MRNREPQQVLGVDVHLDRRCGPDPREPLVAVRAAIAVAAALCAVLLACLASVASGAVPALSWSSAGLPGSPSLTGVSCATNKLCVAVDKGGDVYISDDPTAGAGSTWNRVAISGAGALAGVSCASESLCVAVNGEGRAFISVNPTAEAGSTWRPREIDEGHALNAVSCASGALCVAVDGEGRALVSVDPTEGASSTWNRQEIDEGHALSSVSCTTSLCVAVDGRGQALASGNPAAGTWQTRPIDSNPAHLDLTSVSCSPSPAAVCVAADGAGEAFASGNPTAPTGTWNATPVDTRGTPTGVACTAPGLCTIADDSGHIYTGDDPTVAEPSWNVETVDSPTELTGISCESEGLCAAADKAGHILIAQVPPPVVVTSTPTALAETTATVTGTVDTDDAALTSCRFEYGTSEAYGQSTPCPALAAGSANQPVSATLSGLTPNATYDYRLVAVSASGEGRTANATFKTTAPPLVQPHPSISGIPAPGQRLTCKSGVSGSGASSATLSYAWLRNAKGISGASGSTYVVGSADVSHHLQCRVTATNAGGSTSATSAFVTVPAGGLGAISETQVGTPRVAGRTVSVTVTCSAQAAGSCTITLRLTVVETLRRGRVIAVAATQRTSHKTVTVGAVTAHVPPGQRGTVTVALNATGRRLLKSLHKLSAKLSVSGTVVGALSAQLRSATVTLGGGAGKASSHKASAHHSHARRGQ